MFKLLIADDEALSREWLAQEIPWEANDICVVGPAVDGSEAWRLFEAEEPEIILTDIRMPGMDGIELARAVLARRPHTRVLVISGFDEFAYAKACLELGVSGYILKPSPKQEILGAVLKERDYLQARRADERQRALLQSRLENNMPLLREQFLRDVLCGTIDEGVLAEQLEFLGLNIQPDKPVVAFYMEVEDAARLYLDHDERERQLIWFGMYGIAETALGERGLATRLERGGIGALIGTPDDGKSLLETASRIAHAIMDEARLGLPCAVAIGVGETAPSLIQAHHSFEQARQALRTRYRFGVEAIVMHRESGTGEKQWPSLPPVDEERLVANLLAGKSTREIKDMLQKMYGSTDDAGWRREIGLVLAGTLTRVALRHGLAVRNILDNADYALLMQGGPEVPPAEAAAWWEVQFGQLGHALRKLRSTSSRSCIRQVQEYVEAHLSENVSLSQAARHVFMNPSYLSRLFREETDESYSEFVTRRKMEEARRLLDQRDFKVYEASSAVGYADPAYFSRVFRRHFGVTPSEYRDRGTGA